MTISRKMSFVLALAVGLAATFQAGWEFGEGGPSSSLDGGATRQASMGWGKRVWGITWVSAVAGLVALLATRRSVTAPLRSMVETSRTRRSSPVWSPSDWNAKDEFVELAQELEELRQSLETKQRMESDDEAEALARSLERLRHWDRLSTLSRVASTLAHELGTPLNVIDGRATMLLSGDLTAAEVQKNAQIIAQQSSKMTNILQNLVTFARRRPLAKSEVDLVEVVRAAVALARPTARAHEVTLSLEESVAPLLIELDQDRTLQVIMNLLLNGVQATPKGGALVIKVLTESRAPQDDPEGPVREFALVEVIDAGEGCADDVFSKLFQPFFTTKSADQGVGLGLAVAQSIAKDHGGFIAAKNQPGGGACFTLFLPKGSGHAE